MSVPASLPDDEELRRQFGVATYVRGRSYFERGQVLDCTYQVDDDGDLDIRGRVAGSQGEQYSAFLSVGAGDDGWWTYTRCNCPVADQCKHALALLLYVVDAEQAAAADPVQSRRWERQLDQIVDELDADADVRSGARRPLGLLFEIADVGPRAGRFGDEEPRRRPRALTVRPVHRGSRDNWVRSGISWTGVPYLDQSAQYAAEQAAALHELLAVYRASARHGYLGAEHVFRLATYQATLWPALERAVAAGIELVPGKGLAAVTLAAERVALEVDVTTRDDGRTQVRAGAWQRGLWYDGADIDVLGDSGHGAVLWTTVDPARPPSVVLARLQRPVGPHVRRLVGEGHALVVPAEARDDLLGSYLPRIQRHLPVGSSDGSVVVAEPATPRLALAVTWVAADQVELAWSWRYRVGEDDRVYGLSESRGLRAGVRRPDAERAVLDRLDLDLLQRRVLCGSDRADRDPVEQQTLRRGEVLVFAEDVLPGLVAGGQVEVDEVGARPTYREAGSAPVIHFATRVDAPDGPTTLVDDRTDWLDLEVVITVDGTPLGLGQLLTALTRGDDRIVLHTGLHVRTDLPEFHHLAELVGQAAELREQPDDVVRVGHHDLGLWEELAEVGVVDEQAAAWVRQAQALRDLESLPTPLPVGIKGELRGYQVEGFCWLAFLWESGLGGILADDMGLGKTLQTLALAAYARERGAAPFLVVAPTSVVSTWAREAEAFTPGLRVRTVTESHARRGEAIADLQADADIVVTSYTLYRLEVDSYVELEWGGLILDEAQLVKNHRGKTHQGVRRLPAPFRLAITGTPMENRLIELWSLLSIVAPGLYPYPEQFNEHVAVPVEKLGDADALARFQRRIRPFLLRRTKELVASDLPPKQEQVLEVQLTPRHRRVYDVHLQRERQQVLGLVDEFDKNRIAIFGALTRLRQLSLDAALLDEAYDGVGSAKLDVLVDHLHEILAEGHRALVFSQFTSYLARVRDRLDREGISASYLDGRTRRRGDVIEEFKQGDSAVFLISLKAGGVGLTLTEADYVFVLDPWWNPAVEAQAVDRAHRIGQRRPVMVYRLVSADTIEDKVMELKARKAELFSKVVDGDGASGVPIDASDVRALFAD